MTELKIVIKEVEKKYRSSKIVNKKSEFGDQLFFSWRSRRENLKKKSVAHFHIHVYPKHGAADDSPQDENSHIFDVSLLRG